MTSPLKQQKNELIDMIMLTLFHFHQKIIFIISLHKKRLPQVTDAD